MVAPKQIALATGALILGDANGRGSALSAGANGTVLSIVGGVVEWSNAAGTGTVTSVAVSPGSNKLSVSGSPITTNGVITVDVVPGNIMLQSLSGSVLVIQGGTGLSSTITNGVLVGGASNTYAFTPAPTVASTFLEWNGTAFVWGTGGAVTFPLQAPNGSSSAPSYSFASGTDSGLFAPSNGAITLQSSVGDPLNLITQNATGTNASAGSINITGGTGTGTGAPGSIYITAGALGGAGTGAVVHVTGGAGTGGTGGGGVTVLGGNGGATGVGANVGLLGGSGGTTSGGGGGAFVGGGTATAGNGGNTMVFGGNGGGVGTGGYVRLFGGLSSLGAPGFIDAWINNSTYLTVQYPGNPASTAAFVLSDVGVVQMPALPDTDQPTSPSAGMLYFSTTQAAFLFYNGGSWVPVGVSSGLTLQNNGTDVGTPSGVTTLNVTNTTGTALAATGVTTTGTINFNPANVNLSAFGPTLVSGQMPNTLFYATGSSAIGQVVPTGTSTFLQWTGSSYQWVASAPGPGYSTTFNASGSWGSVVGGYYSITISESTHNQGVNPIVEVFDSTSGPFVVTSPAITSVDVSGNVTFSVTSSPDERFAGKVTIVSGSGTGAGSGTVTSVALTSSATTINVTGMNPVTTAGTINVDVNQGNLSLSSIGGSLNLASQVSGTLAVTHGGTGLTSVPSNNFLVGAGSSALTTLAPTGIDTFLQWTGSGYQWALAGGVNSVGLSSSGTITVGGTNPVTGSGTITVDVNQANLNLASIGGTLNLGTQATGTLATTDGGTGLSSFTANEILYAATSSTIGQIAPTGTNTFLQWTGTAYQWATPSSTPSLTLENNGSPVGTPSGITTLNVTNSVGTALSASGITSTGNINFQPSAVNLDAFGGTLVAGQTSNDIFVATSGTTIGQIAPTGIDTFLQWTGSAYQWVAIGGSGTVTSVQLASSGTITVSGTNPITTSGTISVDVDQANLSLSSIGGALNLSTQVSGTLATTHGGTGLTSFTANDLFYASSSSTIGQIPPTGSGTFLEWNGSTYQWSFVSLTSQVTGILGATFGGTGQNLVGIGDLLYGSATNVWSLLAPGTNGQVLTISGGLPAWTTPVSNVGAVLAITQPFSYTQAGTVVNISSPITGTVLRVKVVITTAFNVALTVDIGDTVTYNDLVTNPSVDTSTLGIYLVEQYAVYGSATQLQITLGSGLATVGAGVVVVEYINA